MTTSPNITVGVHVRHSIAITADRYKKGPGEARDRIVVQLGEPMNCVHVFLDGEGVDRLVALLTGEQQWFAEQAENRIPTESRCDAVYDPSGERCDGLAGHDDTHTGRLGLRWSDEQVPA